MLLQKAAAQQQAVIVQAADHQAAVAAAGGVEGHALGALHDCLAAYAAAGQPLCESGNQHVTFSI